MVILIYAWLCPFLHSESTLDQLGRNKSVSQECIYGLFRLFNQLVSIPQTSKVFSDANVVGIELIATIHHASRHEFDYPTKNRYLC